MSRLSEKLHLKQLVKELTQIAIAAADPAEAVNTALSANPLPPLPSGEYKLIAFGKAACAMMEAAMTHLPAGQAFDAIIVTNYENAHDVKGAEVIAAGHPVPDENGLKAAEKIEALLHAANADDHVICLISGGGSALLPAPAGLLTLAEKADINQMLLSEGFDITQINAVRQSLSRLKGGGFTRLSAPAAITAYILSDVIGDDLRVIASGPTASPIASKEDVIHLLQEKRLYEKLPHAAKVLLEGKEPDPVPNNANNYLIGSNRLSLGAMINAKSSTNTPIKLISDHLVGDVSEACAEILRVMHEADIQERQIFIWGGETTVSITGPGKGGRNQELALRVAIAAEALDFDWAFGSIGTDGRDGPTDAAGGIVDNETIHKMIQNNVDPASVLAQNDSYIGLQSTGDLFKIGPTGTNVADIQILVCQPRQNVSD